MSRLSRLAQLASEYIRQRLSSMGRSSSGSDEIPRPPGFDPSRWHPNEAPPIARPTTGNAPQYDDIEIEDEEFQPRQQPLSVSSKPRRDNRLYASGVRHVESSNVWSYAFEAESSSMGLLYVTFLDYTPKDAGGSGQKENRPGPTYVYHNFPIAKFKQFERLASSSAGSAVWDFCRIRHSKFEHQHTYRLVSVSGEYVPRKVTSQGYAARTPKSMAGRQTVQLPAEKQAWRQQLPARNYAALPNRGAPNRGTPNRG